MTEFSTVERSTVIAAPAASILPHLTDFSKWTAWSPWEGQDPEMKRSYAGTPGATGSTYAWNGNRKAGAGTMAVTHVDPHALDVDLHFTRPFKSTSAIRFDLEEADGSTTVVWSMRSPKTVQSRVMGVFLNMDTLIGTDFEKGLAKFKTVVEG
ncbi:hypothetical protein AS850_06310 [Frondihabitans sp. 762G35]|uniref:SRPBCC family protein n=1 Tax=Frondihabitans sp. 762G35 TaxID=1446794 RepID=UPI000D210042|nr:SRPBCC family protein [Frondihabitans sp. 762G35]ARC56686.1 hypothetical protein AS850_06310 [Frondihabitans sp. 762G35]